MRVILDECLPKRLAGHIAGHEVTTVPLAGFAGFSNGKLLAAIEKEFEVFVTIDGNLQWQQTLEDRSLVVIVVSAVSNRLEDLLPLVPKIIEALKDGDAGPLRHVQ